MTSINDKYLQQYKILGDGTENLETPQEYFPVIFDNICHNIGVFIARLFYLLQNENDYKINWLWSDHDVKKCCADNAIESNLIENKILTIKNSGIDNKQKAILQEISKIFNKSYAIHYTKIDKKIFIKFIGIDNHEIKNLNELLNNLDHSIKQRLTESLFEFESTQPKYYALEGFENFDFARESPIEVSIPKIENAYPNGLDFNPAKRDFQACLSTTNRLFLNKDREERSLIQYVKEEWQGDDAESGEEISFANKGNELPNSPLDEKISYSEEAFVTKLRESLLADSGGDWLEKSRKIRDLIFELEELAYKTKIFRNTLGPWFGRISFKNVELKALAIALNEWDLTEKEVKAKIIRIFELFKAGRKNVEDPHGIYSEEMIYLHDRILKEGYNL